MRETDFPLPSQEMLELLGSGNVEVLGRVTNSSNVTLLTNISNSNIETLAIYKPIKGERPLADFAPGLHKREAAAYKLSNLLAWGLVPPTIIREGPYGEGSFQAFVDFEEDQHYFTLLENSIGVEDLKKICALDYVMNNTDRKAGHCLLSKNNNIYAIDHGLTFHAQYKLRTVIWDFAGQTLPAEIVESFKSLDGTQLEVELKGLLTSFELDALQARLEAAKKLGTFCEDETGGHRWPWPPI